MTPRPINGHAGESAASMMMSLMTMRCWAKVERSHLRCVSLALSQTYCSPSTGVPRLPALRYPGRFSARIRDQAYALVVVARLVTLLVTSAHLPAQICHRTDLHKHFLDQQQTRVGCRVPAMSSTSAHLCIIHQAAFSVLTVTEMPSRTSSTPRHRSSRVHACIGNGMARY